MLEMIRGAKIPFAEKLHEGYVIQGAWLWANVNASNMINVFKGFLELEQSQSFSMFLEVPVTRQREAELNRLENLSSNAIETFHKDVYYLDNISGEMFLRLMDIIGSILIHDGMSAFGIISQSGNEVGKYKYNIMKAYSSSTDLMPLKEIFENNAIYADTTLINAWDLFSPETPGESNRYTEDGRDIYTVLETLTETGMYKAETQEE